MDDKAFEQRAMRRERDIAQMVGGRPEDPATPETDRLRQLASEIIDLRAALELAKQHEHHPACGMDGYECWLCKQIDAALSSPVAA